MSLDTKYTEEELDDLTFEKLAQEKMNAQMREVLNSILKKLENDTPSKLQDSMAGIEAGIVNLLAAIRDAQKQPQKIDDNIVNSLQKISNEFSNSLSNLRDAVVYQTTASWEFKIERNSLSLIDKVIATRK
jgi:molecular chaperone GrpE (heat shock protein)